MPLRGEARHETSLWKSPIVAIGSKFGADALGSLIVGEPRLSKPIDKAQPDRVPGASTVEVGVERNLGDRVSQRAAGLDARSRRGGLRRGGLGGEECHHAVTDVPADETTGLDHAAVSGAHQATREREVAGRRQPTGQRRRPLEIGEQDRPGPAARRSEPA